jgi:glycosyltransferase involved in cell wall biosynthesis
MHILFLTDNFPPEVNAPASRTYDHASAWVAEGKKVTVITCAPNFPDGIIFEGYKNKFIHKENINGINVWRVKTYITSNEGVIKRAIDFISFMVSSFFFGLFTRRVDVVIGTSPQFFTVLSAWLLAKLKRVPFVFELRDIWPASIYAVGVMKKNIFISFFERLEIFLYHQADLIISVTNSFKAELVKRGICNKKIKIVLNGSDLEKFTPISVKDTLLSNKYGLDGKFVVGYIGTHGLAHALENVVRAAELLQHNKKIIFLFVGGGAGRERVINLINAKGLKNTILIPSQPKEAMPKFLSLCNTSLVHLRDSSLFRTVIPSKIFESMAVGLPIICSMPYGEATDIIKKYNIGLCVPPENPRRLVKAIIKMQENTSLQEYYSAKSLVGSKDFDRKKLAIKMLKHIEEIVN